MFDVITIGSATRDVFVRSKSFKAIEAKEFATGEALAMALGSKLDIDEIRFAVGGGAVNTAVTFANQGFRAAVLCVVGKDPGGDEIVNFLKGCGIETKFIFRSEHGNTAYSLILSIGEKDRTVLRYQGVEWQLDRYELPWLELSKTRWLYLNHFGNESHELLNQFLPFAKQHNIKVAWNPGKTQFENKKEIIPLLKYADVFIVNQEEASMVTGIPYQNTSEIFRKLDEWVQGIVIMTKGPEGVEVSDGKTLWSAGVLPLKKVVDRTGAGDAFGSGFAAALIQKPGDIDYAIQFASANATGVLTQWGAVNGLFKKGESIEKWGTLKIQKKTL